LIVGALFAAGGTLIICFADGQHNYWRLCVPGFFLGSAGAALVFISANNAVLMSVPPKYSG
jgi:hypothetical protein